MRPKENDGSPPTKIGQLVNDAKAELLRVGIETEGKRSDEILNMAREVRNKPRVALSPAQGVSLFSVVAPEADFGASR